MSAWVLFLDDKGSIHEGCEWKRSIARRKARGRISIAFRNAPHGIITVERVFYAHGAKMMDLSQPLEIFEVRRHSFQLLLEDLFELAVSDCPAASFH